MPASCARHAGQLGSAAMMVRSCFSDGACGLSAAARCDVVDQIRAFFVHGPDVPALGNSRSSQRETVCSRTAEAGPTYCHTLDRFGSVVIAGGYPLSIGDGSRAIRESPKPNQCLCSKRSETPLLLAEDIWPLMVRADTTAPVFNDEEKRARATPQVHKVARERLPLLTSARLAFSAGCDSATTLFAVARHVGVLHLLFARELRLRRKWRGAFDQLPVSCPRSRRGCDDYGSSQRERVRSGRAGAGLCSPSHAGHFWTVGHGWGNSHHPSGTVSALLGNSRTAISVSAGCPTVFVWTLRNRGRVESVSRCARGPFPGVAQHFG